jgi:tetratricopeptide (TPR) repeat protein
MKFRCALLIGVFFIHFGLGNAQRPRQTSSASTERTLTVQTEPNAIVWIDEIRRGSTDATGKLSDLKVTAGAHTLRVRASGFKENSQPIAAAQRGTVRVQLLRTTDQAELLFQQAEAARESARDEAARRNSVDLYRRTLKLRPAFASAHVGLARVLLDLNDTNAALAEIDAARRDRPNYPEASAVEGRIYRETGQIDDAIGAFNRAIRESHGFQPEAHVGLGRTYEEKGQYELAAREFDIAIKQLADTEPIIYQLLGAAYEKSGNNASAIAAYENYLRLAPNGSQASAIRSIVEQLKSQQPDQPQIRWSLVQLTRRPSARTSASSAVSCFV